ncbi:MULTISPECIES: NADH:flavin oxidoreductase/NADH oxidase [Stenotrophomonas maltophilia group]|uniref:oxidoreductase n=1 Tax=Stenotrophomonas maltophilia group TaxID=995085 RepID=UPI000F677A70|nr:NADH:flavin oxidoreductase/NADH oxidase [Stenotrophomonas maltophilia]RRU71454.1 NADH:flavin oxidoreductase/NADH oxidase [Stenotrophomonas maltophilia]
MSMVFSPYTMKGVTLRNRIAVAPMCQYQAHDGYLSEWHAPHYAGLARGGAGLVVIEATAVSPEGRITPSCAGLWEDGHIEGMARVAAAITAGGAVPGIQLAHAGRKASANLPWKGDDHIAPGAVGGWTTLAPSALPFGGSLSNVPQAMSLEDIERVKGDFVHAAQRALAAGFKWLELHFAHGYLAQSFFSAASNVRTDRYGGSEENRHRFLIETLEAVRAVWPDELPLTVRFGIVEFDGDDEQRFPEVQRLVASMKHAGLDLLNASIGFTTSSSNVPWSKGLLLPWIRRLGVSSLPMASAWLLDDPLAAEAAVADGSLAVVMMGRAFLANPHYVHVIAQDLGMDNPAGVLPSPYAHWLARYRGAGREAAL